MSASVAPIRDARLLSPPAIVGLLTVVLVCVSRAVLNDGDTYIHVAAGEWMLDHRAVLKQDPFTATFAGQPWQAHEWLSEVLLGLAHRAAGLTGVVLLTAAAVGIGFANLARHIGRCCGWRATMALTAAALVCTIPSILARPHMLALPVLELWVADLLLARSEQRAPSCWLLPVMVVWANLHGGFAFGLAIAAVFALEASLARVDRRTLLWWGFVLGATAAAVLTPQFVDGLVFPLRLLQMHSLGWIKEWQPINLETVPSFDGVLLGLVALLLSGRVKLPVWRAVVLSGLLYLALAHARHLVLFGIAGSLILAEPVGHALAEAGSTIPTRRGWGLCGSGVALVAMLRLAYPVADVDSPVAPVSALAQLPPELGRAAMINSYQFGGYLALAGLHPFVDGRAELFGDAFLDEFDAMSQPDRGALRRGVDRYGIQWALLAVDDPLVAGFDAMAGWRRHYADGVAVVFVKG